MPDVDFGTNVVLMKKYGVQHSECGLDSKKLTGRVQQQYAGKSQRGGNTGGGKSQEVGEIIMLVDVEGVRGKVQSFFVDSNV